MRVTFIIKLLRPPRGAGGSRREAGRFMSLKPNESPEARPRKAAARRLLRRDLLGGAQEVVIEHDGDFYRPRCPSTGKRSEEHRGGKGCVWTGRAWWCRESKKTKNK